MNYRHAFHAGNFADLVKHAALTLLLDASIRDPAPLTIVDTHAGAGAYDLQGEMAMKSGEGALDRLMAAPAAPEAFDMLVAAVARANPNGGARIYPGSPAIACAALRPGDRLYACELRPDDHQRLEELLAPLAPQAKAERADGFAFAAAATPETGRVLVLIDPPFERGDDYKRIAAAVPAILRRNGDAVIAVWTPLKDLDTFDRFLTGLEAVDAPGVLVCEVRLRPLSDPMKLNGCAMVVVNAPTGFDTEIQSICHWIAQELGDPGNESRVWRL